MRVDALLTGEVFATDPRRSLREAAQEMAEHRVGSVVVLEDGKLAGILTERDMLKAVAAGTNMDEATVGEIMTKDVVTAGPHWEVYEAAAEMIARRFRHLVVCEDDRVVGVVSVRDVLLAGKRIELTNGNWAVLRDPLTLTVRERKMLQRYLARVRDGDPNHPQADDLVGLLVAAWSFGNGDSDETGSDDIPKEDHELLKAAVLNEIPALQRAVHPAPGWRNRS